MEIKNLKKAAEFIKKAVRAKERIILYGDSDMDGVSSVVIIQETLKNLGSSPAAIYFPERGKEGYGLTQKALTFLKKYSPGLLITLDCGISNFKEIAKARKIGFEVIVVDHHEPLEKLPKASIVVNPLQKGDKYPFKFFASSGLAFRLAQELLQERLTPSLRRTFLELSALGTLADMMPEEQDNKEIIEEGLASLEQTFRPALQVFFEMDQIQQAESTRKIAQEIISILNIVEPRGVLNATYLILSAESIEEARALAKELMEKREQKREQIRDLTVQVEDLVQRNPNEPIIFEASSLWPIPLLGSVASRICQKYNKPCFLVSKGEKESRGSIRVPPGMNSVALMKKCSKHLLSFGGHAPASGFTIKTEKLEKFRDCLIKNIQ